MKAFPSPLEASTLCMVRSKDLDKLKAQIAHLGRKTDNGLTLGYCTIIVQQPEVSIVSRIGLTLYTGKHVTQAQLDAALLTEFFN